MLRPISQREQIEFSKCMIASYLKEEHHQWDKWIAEFHFAINSAVQKTTKYSLAHLALERCLRGPFDCLVMVSPAPGTKCYSLLEHHELLKDILIKNSARPHRSPSTLSISHWKVAAVILRPKSKTLNWYNCWWSMVICQWADCRSNIVIIAPWNDSRISWMRAWDYCVKHSLIVESLCKNRSIHLVLVPVLLEMPRQRTTVLLFHLSTVMEKLCKVDYEQDTYQSGLKSDG